MKNRGRWRAMAAGAGLAVAARAARYVARRARKFIKSRKTIGRKRRMNISRPRPAKKMRGIKRKMLLGASNYLNQGPGNELYKWKRTSRIQRPTLKKFLYPTTITRQDRFQGLTNFDTDGGYSRLSYLKADTDDPKRYLPIAIFDLTSFTNMNQAPPVAYHLGWASGTGGADYIRGPITGQTGGSTLSTPTWTTTDGDGFATEMKKVYLKWIDIRLNFYGARKRTTQFEAQIVQFKNDYANLHMGPLDNSAAKNLLAYMERPLLFNNLQVATAPAEKLRVLKKFKWTVGPTTSIDLNTTTGKIQEAKIFLKMNKALNLDYAVGNNYDHNNVGDGADFQVDNNYLQPNVRPQSRTYLILKAFCPALTSVPAVPYWERSLVEGALQTPPGGTALNNADEPSFDFLIRRKYYSDK